MLATSNARRHLVSRTYIAGSKALTGSMLRGRSGARDFSRVIVVSAFGRNNGITSGARLQWAALRQLGVGAELLLATPAVRNPLFRVPHVPGSAFSTAAECGHLRRATSCRTTYYHEQRR
jgi:hypothetical protein